MDLKLDYDKLGLKCGIEIHQQLGAKDTDKKLFCDCPCIIREDKPDVIITRKLRAAAGETGKVDVAAAQEQKRDLDFIYEGYSNTNCLVETDDEPPHQMNKQALDTVLEVSLLLKANIVENIQVMRKTVVDGSNTSGFQRTSLVARNGIISTKQGSIHIPTICIEEDACKIIEKGSNFVRYGLDRLGIPLIELATDPDIKNPEQAKEVAEYIGMILRSTGKVKRGLGTIRQDVNVSIKEGERIEIKGAQDLKMLPTLVEYEVLRQIALVELKKLLEKSKIKINKTEIIQSSTNLTSIFKNTNCKFVNSAIKQGQQVIGFKIPNFSTLLGKETQPGKRIGSELSDYAKIKAGIGGIIHSDEDLNKYKFSEKEINSTKQELKISNNDSKDAFALIVAEENQAKKAIEEIAERLELFKKGVLKEVRRANKDGTSNFMRPIPGSARMYPETDIPVVKLTKDYLKTIKLPELIEEKSSRFKEQHQLGKDLANLLAKSGKTDLFEQFMNKFKNLKASFVAETILTTEKSLKRNYNIEATIPDDVFEQIFHELNKGSIIKDIIMDLFIDYANTKSLNFEKYRTLTDQELKKEIEQLKKENKELAFNALIGKAMGKLKGKADPNKIIALLK